MRLRAAGAVWKRCMTNLELHVRAPAKENCGRKSPLIVPAACHLRLESSETEKPQPLPSAWVFQKESLASFAAAAPSSLRPTFTVHRCGPEGLTEGFVVCVCFFKWVISPQYPDCCAASVLPEEKSTQLFHHMIYRTGDKAKAEDYSPTSIFTPARQTFSCAYISTVPQY